MAAVGIGVQLVPLGAWQFSNPPVVDAARFPTAEAEEVARAACFDCHSHETRYPPYAYVAPASWLLQRDVAEGRDELNFSDFGDSDSDDAADAVRDGSMPPSRYTLLHPGARLDEAEATVLVEALERMARD